MPDASIGLRDLKIVKILLAAASAFSTSSFWDDPFGSLFGGDAFPIKQLLGLLKRDLNTVAEGRDSLEGLFSIPQATDGQRRVGPRDFILRTVAEGINTLKGPDMGILLITHYQRILDYITPDFVHVFVDGRIVAEGGPELAHTLEAEGYEAFTPAAVGGEAA